MSEHSDFLSDEKYQIIITNLDSEVLAECYSTFALFDILRGFHKLGYLRILKVYYYQNGAIAKSEIYRRGEASYLCIKYQEYVE